MSLLIVPLTSRILADPIDRVIEKTRSTIIGPQPDHMFHCASSPLFDFEAEVMGFPTRTSPAITRAGIQNEIGLHTFPHNFSGYPKVVEMTAFLYALFMMCLDLLYPVGGAMSVAICRRVYARIRNGWYLSICSRLHRDLHSRFPWGLEAIQTQIVSVED